MRRRRPSINTDPSHANNLAALSGGFFFVHLSTDSIHRLRWTGGSLNVTRCFGKQHREFTIQISNEAPPQTDEACG
jgi:hypothetical protein